MNTVEVSYWKKYLPLLMLATVLVLVVAACGRRHESWAGVVSYGEGEDQTIIVSYRRQVISLDADGSVNWIYDGDDADFYAKAILDGEHLYVGDYKGRIHAIDIDDGDNIWTYEEERTRFLFFTLGSTDRIIAPITLGQVKGEKALFFGNEHGVHALVDLDSDEPNVAWSFETQHSVWAQPLYLTIAAQGDGIALPQNRLFAGSLDKQLYSLDPDTGKEIWSTNLGGSIVAPPVYDAQRQRLYVGTLDSEVYAISLNGEKVGRYDTEGWVWGTPKLYQESIYFTDLKGWIYELALTPLNELNTDTDQAFSETWKLELTDESAALRASPTIYEPLDNPERPVLLVSGADKRVYALDLFDPDSPSILWNKELADVAYSEIVVVHEIEDEQTQELVVISTYDEDHLLVALRLDNGKEEWSHQYDD